jgi:hypothetical protein
MSPPHERPSPEEVRNTSRHVRAHSAQLRMQLQRLRHKSEQLSNHVATRLDELIEPTIRQEVCQGVTSDEDVSTGFEGGI